MIHWFHCQSILSTWAAVLTVPKFSCNKEKNKWVVSVILNIYSIKFLSMRNGESHEEIKVVYNQFINN